MFPDLSKAERAAKVDHYVGMVGLGHAATRRPAELSGGMRQRIVVVSARLLVREDLVGISDAREDVRCGSEMSLIARTAVATHHPQQSFKHSGNHGNSHQHQQSPSFTSTRGRTAAAAV